ncbi:MMPL family transporter [Nocardia farcinica]|uniref:MMPL family transporter n=1 Tax=Nocardia farcinica TaxID=37329 RepID=UPI000E03D8FC|nr:MMPL family transporter [Nocardia farcinica]MBF6070000.1 MMPL family transporter [Nocardia farcinica]MBF6290940.1 MMPL family transporter [Nocardia farcinica]MBF6380188.1 MMPL family transporter [Nocardia farcinica]SUE31466.1 integral membrane protein mmpl5 [Nocardia farcinica]
MFDVLGGFIVRRARWILVASVLALVAGAALGVTAFGKMQSGGQDDPGAESSLAATQLREKFGSGTDYLFLVRATGGSIDDEAAAAFGRDLTARLAADPRLADVVSYWDTGSPAMRAADGTAAVILAGNADPDTEDHSAASGIIADYRSAGPVAQVQVGGTDPTFEAITEQIGKDLGLAEGIAVPLILALLVLAFGNVVAALLTLLTGGIAILGTFAELSVLGSLTDVSIYAVNLTTALGLGLAVDYGLLMVARFRERRAAGATTDEAVVGAVATAGRTIVFSAATVVAALSSLVIFPQYFLRSFAYAGIGVVAISALAAVLTLPALLAVLGDRSDAWHIRGVRGIRGDAAPFWAAVARTATRRPLLTGVPVVLILLLAAAPLLGVRFGTPDDRVLPTTTEVRQVGDAMRTEFGGGEANALSVVIGAAVPAQPLADYAAQLSRVEHVTRVDSAAGTFVAGRPVATSPADLRFARPDAQRLEVHTGLDRNSTEARELVDRVRAVPEPAGATALVGGQVAELRDSLSAIGSRLPIAVGWIVATTFVLLFLFTGSVVQPVRALLSNALSLAATLGLMVFVFQDGHLSGLLGFTPAPLDVSMLLLLFCITFGLSMDYEVFVVSRIKEVHDRGADTETAVIEGVARTGRLVTTAAALISISFLAFVSSDVRFIQFFGLGAGLAILIDATLVRGVLVPVAMRLLGPAAWFAPRPLRVVHRRFGLAEA